MNYPKYSFEVSDLEITFTPRWEDHKALDLVREVFDLWIKPMSLVDSLNEQIRVSAKLIPRTEGKSPAEVCELAFSEIAPKSPVLSKFIIRAHFGQDASILANRERQLVKQISTSESEFFSSSLVDPITSVPNTLVYRHADDQLDAKSELFNDYLVSILKSKDTKKVEDLSNELHRFVSVLIRVYDRFQNHTLVPGHQYFERISKRLAPDIIIDAYDRRIVMEGDSLKITTDEGDLFASVESVESQSAENLWDFISSNEPPARRWTSIKAWPAKLTPSNGYLRFKEGNLRIWIRIDENSIKDLQLKEQLYEIVFKQENTIATTAGSYLERLKFSKDSCLSIMDFRELCKNLDQRLEHGARHTDLHCKNILVGSGRVKVIDLSSLDPDILYVSQARLEISIWAEATKALQFELEEAERILTNLQTNTDPSQYNMSWEAWALNTILLALRRGTTEGTNLEISPIDYAVAYATQVLLHQRYAIEQNNPVSIAFDAVTRHYLRHFEQLVTKQPLQSIEVIETIPPQLEYAPPSDNDPLTGKPTMYSLWKLALRSRTVSNIEPKPLEFLETISKHHRVFMQSPLTSLQQKIWAACKDSDPFRSDQHAIIAAPTSSGKSTVAEMFLVGPNMLNQRRMCSIYIAPTRALTQAKYRELRNLFEPHKPMYDSIVLSTGEDEDDDWRINHGRFSIACMVYEKANILFSQNRRLLERLGCIVVDETHMLTDINRGPILEMVLTKSLWERSRIDRQSRRNPKRESMRIITLSTEDKPDPVTEDFLSITDPETGEIIKPLIFLDTHRPVKVHHLLVFPGKDATSYKEFPIVEFTNTENRTLSEEKFEQISKKLISETSGVLSRISPTPWRQMRELQNSLEAFILDRLAENPYGYRLLVFVPSRTTAEQVAGRIKNRITKRSHGTRLQQLGDKFRHDEIIQRLKPIIDNSEDQRKAKVLRECTAIGVFIHHSDIDKRIRREIEKICADIKPTTPSQVIISTETLSYGVNLAIHDVILFGTEFYSQNRSADLTSEALTTCAFHNMAGRAGRLGKTRGDAHVYIFIPQGIDATGIIKDYYLEIFPPQSRLYVRDDRAVQLRAENSLLQPPTIVKEDDDPCWKYSRLGALNFSYPFVRSVLDALRHLNISSGRVSPLSRSAVEWEALMDLFGFSLYAGQYLRGRNDTKELQRFSCALRRILDDCARETLGLVDAEGDKTRVYRITPRGEAIIDTGTEIHTVESLLTLVASFHTVWKSLQNSRAFPTELYILCIVAQNEVFRQYIYYAPESKGREIEKDWPEEIASANRQFVFDAFVKSIKRIVALTTEEAQNLGSAIRDLFDEWAALRIINAGYTNGASDSLIRFFNSTISWINLDDRSIVDQMIEGPELPEQLRGRMQGLRQFTDLLNIKTLFLSKLLAKNKKVEALFGTEDERNLHLLASRLRLGCTSEAIPLFWPFSSDVRRKEATRFLSNGITPGRLLSVANPQKLVEKSIEIAPNKLKMLRDDLEKFVKKEFSELQQEMTVGPNDETDLKRRAVHRLWQQLETMFYMCVDEFRGKGESGVGFDAFLRECLESIKSDNDDPDKKDLILSSANRLSPDEYYYRIRLNLPLPQIGMFWIGEHLVDMNISEDNAVQVRRKARQYSKQHTVKIIGIQFLSDWNCQTNKDKWIPFVELLRNEQRVPNLVIVPIPWTPSREELPEELLEVLQERASIIGFSTTFITPAAFAVMVTSILRDFISAEACMKALIETGRDQGLLNVIALKSIQDLIDKTGNRQVVPAIREKLIRHFEVGI